jgi:hypothetical protein
MNKNAYRGHRFPRAIIQVTVWMYARFTLSLRDAVSKWCVPAVARRPTTPQEAEPLSFRKLYRGRPNFALPQYEGKRRYSSQRGGTFRKHGAGEMRAIIWRADLRLHAHLGDAAEARYPLPCEQSPERRPRPPAMLARLYCQPPPTRSQSRRRIIEADHGQTKLDDLPQTNQSTL